MRVPLFLLSGSLVAGCGRPAASHEQPPAEPTPPADTMVLKAGGYRIWLAEGRTATDEAGQACYERSVEVRTDSSRVKVPLLYVLDPPTTLDRHYVRAVLSYQCRPMAVYRVELASGRPLKLEDR